MRRLTAEKVINEINLSDDEDCNDAYPRSVKLDLDPSDSEESNVLADV